ncbi:hypothetical protein [Brevibacillus gelatini]
MLDRRERMNAKRKEDTGFSETVDQHDREFTVETWTQAAFDEHEGRSRRGIHYDPHSLTERYSGELEDRVENGRGGERFFRAPGWRGFDTGGPCAGRFCTRR